jgi:serine/threonine protein phosphatase PrpC
MEDAHCATTSYEDENGEPISTVPFVPLASFTTLVFKQTGVGFFAVYDGHAGAATAMHCSETLHVNILEDLKKAGRLKASSQALWQESEALASISDAVLKADRELLAVEQQTGGAPGRFGGCTAIFALCLPSTNETPAPLVERSVPRSVLKRSTSIFQKPQATRKERALSEGSLKPVEQSGNVSEDSKSKEMPERSEDTAGKHHEGVFTVVVGNVGDSRCLLGRASGEWTAMSQDHKPRNPAEHHRIYAAGGHVEVCVSGV